MKSKWAQELKHHCPLVPYILVGTKLDLRSDDKFLETMEENNQAMITKKEGQSVADEIRVPYLECSSLTQQGKQVARYFLNLILSDWDFKTSPFTTQ